MGQTTQQTASPAVDSWREGLSAMMDGEASELELQRLLRECGQSDGLRDDWRRYQLVSAVLRQQAVEPAVTVDFAQRVGQALVSEAAPAASSRLPSWWPEVARMAVAASVAVVVVTAVQWQRQPEQMAAVSPTPVVAQASQVQTNQIQANQVQVVGASPVSLLSGQQQMGAANAQRQQVQFERYLQYHLERASLNDSRGMVPLARQVSEVER